MVQSACPSTSIRSYHRRRLMKIAYSSTCFLPLRTAFRSICIWIQRSDEALPVALNHRYNRSIDIRVAVTTFRVRGKSWSPNCINFPGVWNAKATCDIRRITNIEAVVPHLSRRRRSRAHSSCYIQAWTSHYALSIGS